MDGKYIVYKHTCPNGKVYIGITSQKPQIRWSSGYKHNKHFTSAIQKYGWDNIKHEILFDNLTKKEACKKEIELIAYYNSTNREFGYNQSIGGDMSALGVKKSPEECKAISERRKGKPITEEQKEKLRVAFLGRKHTELSKLKMSEARKGIPQNDEWVENRAKVLRGKKRSDEICQKFKECSTCKKGVIQYNTNYEVVARYNSIREADKGLNAKGNIGKSLKYCWVKTKGFYWSYEDIPLDIKSIEKHKSQVSETRRNIQLKRWHK